jgi:PhoPQ-activated pathogenicity-related protein
LHLDRSLIALLLAAVPGFARADAPAPPPDLANYLRNDDKSFSWKSTGKVESDTGTVYDLDLTSQTWQGITWTHKLQVFMPKGAKVRPTMVLWNQGGTPSPTSGVIGLRLAQKIGAPVAFLYGVPKQPLFDGKKEDALIAETFVRFLETKDASWPLLFPMVKSVVRAMDALQAFAKKEWDAEVKTFVVTGASKRGWTSWLTAASGDPRVKAIAPLVIDTLNMPVQMKNQVAAFGKPSEMIRDYTERKLVPIPASGEGQRLWKMVDPWVYRDKLTLPKMIINGTNDPYWPLDALNSYWDDLKGEKHILYVPNAGHDLRETDKDGKKELLPERGLNTLSAFCKCQVFDLKMPKLTWKIVEKDDGCRIEMEFEGKLKKSRFWSANSASRDFRQARWRGDETGMLDETFMVTRIDNWSHRPDAGFRATSMEGDFEIDGLTFTLSTQLRIFEAKK